MHVCMDVFLQGISKYIYRLLGHVPCGVAVHVKRKITKYIIL